jgi:hypothetical protein
MIEKIFYEIDEDFWCETRYTSNIVDLLKDKLSGDYSIVITPNLRTLPQTKYKKIAILTGDELGNFGMNPYQNVVAIFRIFNRPNRYDEKFIFPIPPGYNWTMHSNRNNKMIRMYPEKKLSERKYDIFYAAQPLPWRQTLVDNLNRLKDKFNIFSQVNTTFRSGIHIDDYYKMLGDTKIAVVPDGTSPDSFRYVEALGSGCIVIMTSGYPAHMENGRKDEVWYYKNSPVFFINSWNELNEELVKNILNLNIDEIYQKNLEYYDEKLSEQAVANYIIEKINYISR